MAVVVIRPCRSGKEFAYIAIQLYGGIVAADSTPSGVGVVLVLCRACVAKSRAATRVVKAVVRHRRAESR